MADDDSDLLLRALAHRMSQGVEVKTRKFSLLRFRNVFLGKDAVKWLIADPKSGVEDLDGAVQVGQRLIDNGYVVRVSRELKAQEVPQFGRAHKAKKEFRGGDAIYRFDTLRISPFLLHVVVRRARNLTSHDMNGKNDPYVKLRLGTQRAVTRVQLRTNSPEWNELFLFGVSSVEAQQLHMTVRDYDKYKHDDLIGSCNVGLSHLPCEVAADSERKEGGPAGMSVYPGKLSAYSAHGARRGGDGGSGSGYESRLECSVGGSGHVPIGRHDKRTSLLAHESYHVLGDNEYDDDNGLRPSGSQGSDTSAASSVTLLPKSSRTYTSGGSDLSDIDPDDWERASTFDGRSSRSESDVGGGTRRPRPHSVPSSMKSLVKWSRKSVFSQKGVEELFRDSDSETGECGRERKVLLPEKNGSHDEYVYKKRMKRKTSDNVVGRGVVLRGDRGGGGSGGDSLPPLHGSEEAITFYPLMTRGHECKLLHSKSPQEGDKEGQPSRPSLADIPQGELGCDIWLTSFRPQPLPVQGEAKFSLRCRISHVSGVTSSEVRNIGEIGTSIRHKAALMLNGERVFSASRERGKDKKTAFDGTLISLDTRANMATDMLKVVVLHRVAPVELVYKAVATVSIPLRSVPVHFPGSFSSSGADADAGTQSGVAGAKSGYEKPSSTGAGYVEAGRQDKNLDRMSDAAGNQGSSNGDGTGKDNGQGFDDNRNAWHGEPRPRQYQLHTLAGPLTLRTMDNGYITMSLMLVPSGNALLGEEEPVDSEPVTEPLPDLPTPLTVSCVESSIGCGYQRLRKALLWSDSKLMAAYADLLEHSDTSAGPWVGKDGNPGQQEDMSGSVRERSFVIPKSSMSAAVKAQAKEDILLDGPSVMSFASRVQTPAVPFGDKFEVVSRFVLIKEGPQKCRLSISSEAVLSDKINRLIQGQIVSAVSKVSKENYQKLLGLIEDALSGAGPSGGARTGDRRGEKGSRRSLWRWFMGFAVLASVSCILAWGVHAVTGSRPAGYTLDDRQRSELPDSNRNDEDAPAMMGASTLSSMEEGGTCEEVVEGQNYNAKVKEVEEHSRSV